MVTPNEVSTSSENESSLETTDSLPSGDELLIPANWDEQQSEPVATEEVSVTSDEAISDDVSPESEETSETTEEVTSTDTEQTPESTTEIAPEEGEQPEPRMYSQEERNKQEAAYRKQFAEQEKQVTDMQAQVAKMESDYQTQLVDAEVRAYTSALKTQYQDEGMDENQAESRAQRELQAAKQDWVNTQENQKLKQQIAATQAESAAVAMKTSVERMMQTHGVPESQRHLLQGFSDPALLVEASEALGSAEKLRKQQIAARQAEVPSGGEANTFDGGVGRGGTITDQQWLTTVYATGSSNDHARANKVMRSQGINLG